MAYNQGNWPPNPDSLPVHDDSFRDNKLNRLPPTPASSVGPEYVSGKLPLRSQPPTPASSVGPEYMSGKLPLRSQPPTPASSVGPEHMSGKHPRRGQPPTPEPTGEAEHIRYSRSSFRGPPTPASTVGSPAPPTTVPISAVDGKADRNSLFPIFTAIDEAGTGELTEADLRWALINGDWTPFHPVTVHMMLKMFDTDHSGTMNFDEFCNLWGYLASWRNLFDRFDKDQSGSISLDEFEDALKAFGFRLSHACAEYIFGKFSGSDLHAISFDLFAQACISLKRMTDIFKRYDEDRDGYVKLSFEQFIIETLRLSYNDINVYPKSTRTTTAPPKKPSAPGLPTLLEEKASSESVQQHKKPDKLAGLKSTDAHMLTEYATNLSNETWESLLKLLPEILREDLRFTETFQTGPCWTCTPSETTPIEKIPLKIAGAPVVIPVAYHYPLSATVISPPDPRPMFISPAESVSDDFINDIFSIFDDALGFYLLINGLLQIIVPDDFNFDYAQSHRPNEFGGLVVCFIRQSILPTAKESIDAYLSTNAPSSGQTSTTVSGESSTPSELPEAGSSSMISTGKSAATTFKLSIGSMVQANVNGPKVTERFQSKIGLMTISGDQYYLTVSTHMITQALTAANSSLFPGQSWMKDVTIVSSNGSLKVGPVTETFDPDARSFPIGFLHDTSLIGVSNAPMRLVSSIKSPLPADWLSQEGWSNIKYQSQNILLLDDTNLEVKSIGILDSQCQMVGQGIFRTREKTKPKSRFKLPFNGKKSDSDHELGAWTSLVSRSLLYRVNPALRRPVAQSGTAVCFLEESETETPRIKVAGFSSFVQQVSDAHRFDMDGPKLYSRLQEGRVAFYGAFQAPKKLREEHTIV